jgi:cytidine deaminase
MAEQGPEIIFALAGAVGTDLDLVYTEIESGLRDFDYAAIKVHLAGCLRELSEYAEIKLRPHDVYLKQAMDAGDDLRARAKRNDIVALLGIAKIDHERKLRQNPQERRAFIIRSLKHPEEVSKLRETYGSNFYLIAAYTPREQRRERLLAKIGQDNPGMARPECEAAADCIMERDQAEPGMPNGQNLQDTFHLADCFINASSGDRMRCELKRFLDLVFGHPFLTPTRAEHAMFHAEAAALRSAEPGRQVGAAVTDSNGSILALGANEVPQPGGGQVWQDDPAS